ncbi:MAG: hypothetical protein SVX38_12885, partial [Chloroflexota bacterium]|nr:hypothetical protein [Chloroflexota bacterium]
MSYAYRMTVVAQEGRFAGDSGGERVADTLRKVVCKKNREKKLRDFYARFVEGAQKRGVESRVIEE